MTVSCPPSDGSGGDQQQETIMAGSSRRNIQEIVSKIASKIQNGGANALAGASLNFGASDSADAASSEGVTAADLADLRAVAFGSDEGNKVG